MILNLLFLVCPLSGEPAGGNAKSVKSACAAATFQETNEAYTPPKGYVSYRTPRPIAVDGRLDDEGWQTAKWTDDFVDIEGDRRAKPRFRTRVKMLWDDDYFYIAAMLEEPHLQASYTKHDSYIFHEDNDFEVFIDPDGDNHNYAELEMNALNTTWDLRLPRPYGFGGKAEDAWEFPGLKTAVHPDGTLNDPSDIDRGWTIEIAIPWSFVGSLAPQSAMETTGKTSGDRPRDGDEWRINFSRVEWRFDVVNGVYKRRKDSREDNWVWSPQGTINMHQPVTWGYVQFSSAPLGSSAFRQDPAGPAKYLLHRIAQAQQQFHTDNQRYATAIDELNLTNLDYDSLAAAPQLESDGDSFQATVRIRLTNGTEQRWRIRQDALLWQVP